MKLNESSVIGIVMLLCTLIIPLLGVGFYYLVRASIS